MWVSAADLRACLEKFTRVIQLGYARNFARLWAYVGMGAADFGWF